MIKSLHTYETYKRIIDLEERKGRLRKDTFPDDVRDLSADLKELRRKLKFVKKEEKGTIAEQLSEKKSIYEEKRCSSIRRIADKIQRGDFQICLREVDANGKEGYTTGNLPSMLLSKVLMMELKRSYKCTPDNRNNIVEELRALLDTPMHKIVLRADFHSFFESIPQNRIIDKIVEDSYISTRSIKCLKTFIYQYNQLSGNLDAKRGIPRGLSFSSYLAEIYLAAFDHKVMQIEGVYFYKRYVDDIVILANTEKQNKTTLWSKLEELVCEFDLSLSDKESKKACEYFIPDNKNPFVFNYLGYQFRYNDSKLDVLLSEDKFNRYKKCIKLTFEKYKEIGSYSSRRKQHPNKREDTTIQFMHRLNALTSNGHLNGRKNFVLVGIYYSNKYLTSTKQLELLDNYLKECLDSTEFFSPSKSMFQYDKDNNYSKNVTSIRKKIIQGYSFVDGFENRRLYRWNDYTVILRQLANLYHRQQENE